MLLRCERCGAPVKPAAVVLRRKGASHRAFTATVEGWPCSACGHDGVSNTQRRRFELMAAEALGDRASGEAFRQMRDALGLRAAELGELLDVSVETVSRWEQNHRAVPRSTFALLGALIRDAIDGRTATVDALRSLAAPKRRMRTRSRRQRAS